MYLIRGGAAAILLNSTEDSSTLIFEFKANIRHFNTDKMIIKFLISCRSNNEDKNHFSVFFIAAIKTRLNRFSF